MKVVTLSPRRWLTLSRWFTAVTVISGCLVAPEEEGAVETDTQALSGENLSGANLAGTNLAGTNLAGTNLSGANLGGTNLAGTNLAGTNLGGTNLAGNNLAGNNLAGTNLAGTNLAGTNLAGTNLAGTNLSGSNLSGSNLAGTNLAGNNLSATNLAGTNLAGTNLAGTNSGANIHDLTGSMGMLYTREDMWTPRTAACVVMGIGSTAFGKLLGQQSADAKINVALGKLPWGFANTSGGAKTLNAWEALVWGDKTYCVFVLAADPSVTYPGVQGFIKAIFRWNAPPTQSMDISGIEAARSAPVNDTTTSTTITTYTGMMDAAAKFRAGKMTETAFIAGELAFASATTNNQSVLVDFSSWVEGVDQNSLLLGQVTSSSPPTYAEAVYIALDMGNGQVKVVLDDTSARTPVMPNVGSAPMINSVWDLDRAYKAYKDLKAPQPVPRRCAGALYLNKKYQEPMPTTQCDTGLEWSFGFCARGGKPWSKTAGTTGPMNGYMQQTVSDNRYQRTVDLVNNNCQNFRPVLSETYVHMWEPNYDLQTTCTAESDATFCSRNGATCGTLTAVNNCGVSKTVSCGGACPAVTGTTYEAEAASSTIGGGAYGLVCNKSASADPAYNSQGCTRGLLVRSVGTNSNGTAGWVTINDVVVPTTGSYQVTIDGRVGPNNGVAQTRTMNIDVNGVPATTVSMNSVADWDTSITKTVTLTLNSGTAGNSIKFYNPTTGSWAPDLDKIVVANSPNACTAESNTTFCSRLAKNCGNVTAADNCGTSRTVACGSCTSPQTCGGGGTANVCGGSSSTCAAAYSKTMCPSLAVNQKVSRNGHNYTCANLNCQQCGGTTACEPGNTGCPWGAVWIDNGTCN
jgi:uncharacterized protein YjbI with pentapeptide repeats